MSSQISQAAARMDIEPTATINLDEYVGDGGHEHKHVAIEWAGGVLWLDMSEQHDHYCVDVRNLRNGELQPVGLMSILEGRRVRFDDSAVPEEKRLTAHGWPATKMPILMVDKRREEA